MTNEELEKQINSDPAWNPFLLEELCNRAGLLEEWKQADGGSFEAVAYKAAEIIGITI